MKRHLIFTVLVIGLCGCQSAPSYGKRGFIQKHPIDLSKLQLLDDSKISTTVEIFGRAISGPKLGGAWIVWVVNRSDDVLENVLPCLTVRDGAVYSGYLCADDNIVTGAYDRTGRLGKTIPPGDFEVFNIETVPFRELAQASEPVIYGTSREARKPRIEVELSPYDDPYQVVLCGVPPSPIADMSEAEFISLLSTGNAIQVPAGTPMTILKHRHQTDRIIGFTFGLIESGRFSGTACWFHQFSSVRDKF